MYINVVFVLLYRERDIELRVLIIQLFTNPKLSQDSLSHFIFSICTNSGVLSFIVLEGMKLEFLESLPWLML